MILASPAFFIHGFYCHGGQSYASTSLDEAFQAVNDAAKMATSVIAQTNTVSSHNTPFVLSVGSTPAVHTVTPETKATLFIIARETRYTRGCGILSILPRKI